MSTEPVSPPPALEELNGRLKALKEHAFRQEARYRTRRNAYLIAGAALISLSIYCLAILTGLFFRLDAKAIAEIGRQEIEKQLPGGRETVKEYLSAEAPRLMRQALRSLIDLLPRLRASIVADIDERMTSITAEEEGRLVAEMEMAIRSSKAQIDEAFPQASDVEKLERLVSQVAAQFRENIKIAFDELYPKYTAEMSRIHSYLEGLRTSDSSHLTRRERHHKDLIETLLRLMAQEEPRK
jgi:hypothetical protein